MPNDPSITAVMVNITAVNLQPSSQPTFISATPDPVPAGVQPSTSNTNLLAGDVKASMAIVPIGADGANEDFAGATDFGGGFDEGRTLLGLQEAEANPGGNEGRQQTGEPTRGGGLAGTKWEGGSAATFSVKHQISPGPTCRGQ